MTRIGLGLICVIGGVGASFGLIGLLRLRRLGRQHAAFQLALMRSSVPVVAAAIILLTVVGEWALSHVHSRAMAGLSDPSAMIVFKEVKHSNFVHLRDWHRQWLAEHPLPERD